jgi:CubicO group peptidase (beta-lactamase class C family)
MSTYEVLGAVVAIVDAKGSISVRPYGRSTKGGSAIDSSSIFPVASLSKPVFAEIVTTLVRNQVIALDTPIVSYIGSNALPKDARSAKITARQILNHSSGFSLSAQKEPALTTTPGTEWHYSSDAYHLLQQVVEVRTHQTLGSLAQITFAAYDMPSSTFGPLSDEVTPVSGFDRQERMRSDGKYKTISAASTLRTTAGDYARFVRGILGSSDLRDTACSPEVEVDHKLNLWWGRGWAVERLAQGPALAFHWGSNPGYKAFAAFRCDGSYGIVILTNGDQGLEMAPTIVKELDGIDHPLFRFFMLHPND